MADNKGGISWFVRLLLDKKSADQVKTDAQKALGDGTDPTTAKKNVAEVEGAFEKLKRAAAALGAVLASTWVVRQVIAYTRAVFDLGAQVNAVESQFQTVFGTIADGLEESLSDFRKIAGVTDTELQKLLASAGSMGQGMGMSAEASADFASEVIKLAGDLASFSGGAYTTEAAAQLLQSALIGNTEAARGLLINFTALDVQNRAMEMTGKASADALTQEEKALAALAVVTDRAGPQLGDLVRTQKDADNQAKILAATWRQMKEDISRSLLPVFNELFRVLEQRGTIERMAAAAKALAANMGEIVATVIALTKALVISGTIAAVLRLRTAILAANAGTITWLASLRALSLFAGPAGWIALIGSLTLAFRENGKAAREAAADAAAAADVFAEAVGRMDRAMVAAQLSQKRNELKDRQSSIIVAESRLERAKYLRSFGASHEDTSMLERQLTALRSEETALQGQVASLEVRRDELTAATAAASLAALSAERAATVAAAAQAAADAEAAAQDALTKATEAEARVNALWNRLAEWRMANPPPKREGRVRPAGLDLERKDIDRPENVIEERVLSRTEEMFHNLWLNVGESSRRAAFEMSDAFEGAFNLMREEGATIGNFFEGLGRSLAGSMLGGLAEFARGKVAENIAAAIEAGAYALGFSSHLNFPSAAAAWASAAEHSAAAVAWAAAAGGAGAGRSALTGGRGSVPTGTRDAGLSTAQRAASNPEPITIYIDPFNPANPVHTQQIGRAMNLEVRLGGRPEWVR